MVRLVRLSSFREWVGCTRLAILLPVILVGRRNRYSDVGSQRSRDHRCLRLGRCRSPLRSLLGGRSLLSRLSEWRGLVRIMGGSRTVAVLVSSPLDISP